MKRCSISLIASLAALVSAGAIAGACASSPPPRSGAPALWISAYLRASKQGSVLPVAAIDFGAFTHLIHFSVRPQPDGTLDASALSEALSLEAVRAAHDAGRKIVLCVGGSDSGSSWESAISNAATRSALIDALFALVTNRHYDGIDLDFDQECGWRALISLTILNPSPQAFVQMISRFHFWTAVC